MAKIGKGPRPVDMPRALHNQNPALPGSDIEITVELMELDTFHIKGDFIA